MAPGDHSVLRVEGASTHNLRHVTVEIPHGRVTVVTGPSGAGKSSLVLDTIHAEAQRRFVESMSTWARRFLETGERPPFESMTGVLPAIAIEARTSIRNARSTVGTLTETYDVLRLLFAAVGEVGCWSCGDAGPVRALDGDSAIDLLVGGEAGESFVLTVIIPRPKRGANERLHELQKQGLTRVLIDGDVERVESLRTWPTSLPSLELVVGRFGVDTSRARLADSLELAWAVGQGTAAAVAPGDPRRRLHLGQRPTCRRCGAAGREPVAALFSFNSPLGACPACKGFGRVIGVDRERVIPDPSMPVGKRFVAPWNTPAYEDLYIPLRRVLLRLGIDPATPWRELGAEVQALVWKGGRDFTGIGEFFDWLERRSYKVHVRVLLARYRSYDTCPTCAGTRLVPEARAVKVRGCAIDELVRLDVSRLLEWLRAQAWTARERARGGLALAQLERRLGILERVGVGYLGLDRTGRTLSGGETQRLQLATALASDLTSTLYCLDEPTIGLHPRDSGRLLALLRELADRGNTVLVVEHDPALIRGADHLIDMGPAAGAAGGQVLASGPAAEVLASPASITGRALATPFDLRPRRHLAGRRRERGESAAMPRLAIRGAAANNLKGFDVELPLGGLVVVTGVSGSGKSTLVESVVVEGWRRHRGEPGAEAGRCSSIEGFEHLAGLELIDQRPIGRSSRSNPVSFVKAWDDLRALLAATAEAKAAGLTAGSFSFNQDRGRCPTCKGTGTVEIDLAFMAPVVVECEACRGRKFTPAVLRARLDGLDVAEILELTVDQAFELFGDGRKRLARRLGALQQVGLGYLALGQSTDTLSAGEAQRLKLASFLLEPAGKGRRLYVFDEPTTGLHLTDIALLYRTLRGLIRLGHGVVVVEHQLDLVARADWIVDLGPEGGPGGGELLFSGPIENFVEKVRSPTAEALREVLGEAALA